MHEAVISSNSRRRQILHLPWPWWMAFKWPIFCQTLARKPKSQKQQKTLTLANPPTKNQLESDCPKAQLLQKLWKHRANRMKHIPWLTHGRNIEYKQWFPQQQLTFELLVQNINVINQVKAFLPVSCFCRQRSLMASGCKYFNFNNKYIETTPSPQSNYSNNSCYIICNNARHHDAHQNGKKQNRQMP